MITKISLNKVASYENNTVLETDKKVNLIYGLNGTGKSTLSDYLLKLDDYKFKDCTVEGLALDHEILVYNQTFIKDNFFESDSLKGIFTLSKRNKEAETKIAVATSELKRITNEKAIKEQELEKEQNALAEKQASAKDKIWEIKKSFTGGDRVLEFCLEGYKNDGNKLLAFVEGMEKQEDKPTKTIESLKEEVQDLEGDNAKKFDQIDQIKFSVRSIELESLFKKQIVGNEDSTVSELINRLGSSDWVRDGLKYLPDEIEYENSTCPFCQESTISTELFQSIRDYFDESYEADINSLKTFYRDYSEGIGSIPTKSTFEENPKYDSFKNDFELKHDAFLQIVRDNLNLIKDKIKSPSAPISLASSTEAMAEVNHIIDKINTLTAEHNRKIDKKEASLAEINVTFWEIIRSEYDPIISTYISDKTKSLSQLSTINNAIQIFENEIDTQKTIIVDQQSLTISIEGAITSINNGLIDLGIDSFKIKNHSENLYKIVREKNDKSIFQTLSEGERMIISFLYFLELCKGKKDTAEASKIKIIVIDDPISSLSHIYVFNIGRLIHKELLRSDKYEQVFLLTHSLYFFYEMTDTNKERRTTNQKLFRIQKNLTGSEILEMKYEEIQNDYHSYWFIVKDDQQAPALIANCMRNILEYFFNFVEKTDLNNVFQKPAMQEIRFQAFCRYVNRESHSLGQNIFDIKEFNYSDFRDAFALVFLENGYEAHYKKMMG